jgi:flagellar basal-body rod protein FlgB
MAIDLDAVFGIHAQALTWRARRAEVLAANLANADTPGYRARDLDFRGVLGSITNSALPLRTTTRGHLASAAAVAGAGLLYRQPMQPSIDGNTVDTQIEYAEFARNALQYQASLTFLSSRLKTLMTAIRGE